MPNWCENKLIITGPKADIASFKEKAAEYSPSLTPEEMAEQEPKPLNFHSLVPMPKNIIRDKQFDSEDWESRHWGTQSEAAEIEVRHYEKALIYSFITAWTPPIALIQAVAKKWLTLTFILQYDEPSYAFIGVAKAHGAIIKDDRINL